MLETNKRPSQKEERRNHRSNKGIVTYSSYLKEEKGALDGNFISFVLFLTSARCPVQLVREVSVNG